MELQYLGQSTFLVQWNGAKLLIDPMIKGNPLASKFHNLNIKPDYLLLSHGHQDHVADVEQIALNSDVTIISNYEIVSYYGSKGIKGHPMNHGGKWKFNFGTIKMVNAVHSSVLPDGTYAGNPVGFVLYDQSTSIYFAGDTALTLDMKLIPLMCPKLDAAILPIGDNFTMGYEDAIIASDFIECNKIIGCHFDTFELIKIDHSKVKEAFHSKDKTLILPEIGEIIEI